MTPPGGPDRAAVPQPLAVTAALKRSSRMSLEPKVRRLARQYQEKLFPANQSPLLISVSVFVGVFIGVLPTLGVALPLTWVATTLCRLPKGPALIASFVATPPTLFLFFYPLGYFGIGLPLLQPPGIDFDFLALVQGLGALHGHALLTELWTAAKWHVVAFMAGMTIVASVTGVLCAGAVLVVVKRRRALVRRVAHGPATGPNEPETPTKRSPHLP